MIRLLAVSSIAVTLLALPRGLAAQCCTQKPTEPDEPKELDEELDRSTDARLERDTLDTGLLSSSTGATPGGYSAAPNMIGDFFGNPNRRLSTIVRAFSFRNLDIDVNGGSLMSGNIDYGVGSFGTANPDVPSGASVSGTGGVVVSGSDASGDEIPDTWPVLDYNDETGKFGQFGVPLPSVPVGGTLVDGVAFYANGTGAPVDGLPTTSPGVWDTRFRVAYMVTIPGPNPGDLIGRVRLSDNNSALPQDRIFLDYNYFYNVPLTPSGVDVNRFTPGFEKTFCNRQMSFEMRIPMAITLNRIAVADGPADASHYEFGNINLAVKALLMRNARSALAMGLGVSIPSAGDLNVNLADGRNLLAIDNKSIHVTPYLALLHSPNACFFFHAFLHVDVDTNGNPVYVNSVNGGSMVEIGTWNDQTFLYADAGLGYWLRRNAYGRMFTDIAATAELHYTGSVSNADSFVAESFVIGDPSANLDLVNATVGAHGRVGMTTLTVGYSVPITSDDRMFDGEFRVFANRHF
jgi:hypothetical protein